MEILDGVAKAKDNIAQLKLDFTARLPIPNNPAARYSIFVLCNKYGGTQGQQTVGEDYEINKKKSAEQSKFHIKRLRPVFGDRVASLVRETHVEDYKVQRSEQGASLATVNRELACLRRAFNLDIEEELIEKVPRFKLLPEPDTREGYHEPAEFIAFQGLQELSAVVRTATVK